MKFTMTGQEKMWPFNTGYCLIEVTLWAGLTVFTSGSKQYTCSLILNRFEIEMYSNLNVNFVDSDQISEIIHLFFITIGFLGCKCLILIGWLMHTYF